MTAAVRTYAAAGAALVGVGVLAISPVTPSGAGPSAARWNVRLASAVAACQQPVNSGACGGESARAGTSAAVTSANQSADGPSVANIPANLLIAMANVPYNLLNALGSGNVQLGSQPGNGFSWQPTFDGVSLNQPAGSVVGLSSTLTYAGNWWLYTPTNVLGTDPGDVPKYQALVNLLVPFPALSVPLGNMLSAIATSQLPMDIGCSGTGPGACDHPDQILGKMFDLRHVVDMFSPGGYTFPTVQDPVTCNATGQCDIVDPNGPQMPWSGQTIKLDPSAPFTAFYNSLTATPDFSTIHPVTSQLLVNTVITLSKAFNTAFNPFVLGTKCPICAPFVPNPTGAPVPGATFETTSAAPEAVTATPQLMSAPTATAPAADEGDRAAPIADTGPAASEAGDAGTKHTRLTTPRQISTPAHSASPTPTAKTTATTADPTPSSDAAGADNSTGQKAADATAAGPKHRKPATSVRDKVSAGLAKISGKTKSAAGATDN